MKEDLEQAPVAPDSLPGEASIRFGKSEGCNYSSCTNIRDYTFIYATGAKPNAAPWRHLEQTDAIRKEPGTTPTTKIGTMLPPKNVDARLTRRQRDVFNLIVQGMSNKEIARSLKLAEGTVKIHVAARKLGVRRRAAVGIAGTQFFSSPERDVA